MTRRYCDWCDAEIIDDTLYDIGQQKRTGNTDFAEEICGYCANKVRQLREDLRKAKR